MPGCVARAGQSSSRAPIHPTLHIVSVYDIISGLHSGITGNVALDVVHLGTVGEKTLDSAAATM